MASCLRPLFLPLHVAADAQAAMDDVWDDCARDKACRSAYPSSAERLQAVLAGLAEKPVTVRTKHPFTQQHVELTITEEIFSGGLRGLLYGNMFAQAIPFIVKEAYEGDFEPFASKALLFSEGMARTLHLGLYLSVVCTEEIPFVSLEKARTVARGTFPR